MLGLSTLQWRLIGAGVIALVMAGMFATILVLRADLKANKANLDAQAAHYDAVIKVLNNQLQEVKADNQGLAATLQTIKDQQAATAVVLAQFEAEKQATAKKLSTIRQEIAHAPQSNAVASSPAVSALLDGLYGQPQGPAPAGDQSGHGQAGHPGEPADVPVPAAPAGGWGPSPGAVDHGPA